MYEHQPELSSLIGLTMTSVDQVGDVVQLRSGGCLMTISRIGSTIEDRPIECTWFDEALPKK